VRVHHLDCGALHPPFGGLVSGSGPLFARGHMVCHCLLVETDRGLVLIDSGIGLEDIARPVERLGRTMLSMLGVKLDPEITAARQIERLGFDRRDVRHIVLTHLDLDHAGGLSDFPEAKVHVARTEYDAAVHPTHLRDRQRYRPQQWAHGPDWARYDTRGERWNGFECVRDLEGLPPELLLVPLVGHSRGHSAVAVDTGKGWLLHAGDAYFFHGEARPDEPFCPAGLRFFQWFVQAEAEARLWNQQRLRELVRDHADVRVFCAHDETELQRSLAAGPAPGAARGSDSAGAAAGTGL
jgi:glyoxylase-like metal-dependent hydrolase (beta-lactamase superfamily II)